MAQVFIPSIMQHLTNGETQVSMEGRTLRELLQNLEERFPGFRDMVLQEGDFRPDIAIAVDGEVALDLTERVGDKSEIHFIPPIAGGV